VGAFASLIGVIFMDKLPKTRSGKILRATIRKIAEDKEFGFPATIEDPSALDYVDEQVKLWKLERAQKR
jgi:propionyl-CoA synthetase